MIFFLLLEFRLFFVDGLGLLKGMGGKRLESISTGWSSRGGSFPNQPENESPETPEIPRAFSRGVW